MSFPVQSLADNWEFTEMWADTTASPPYVLMLLGNNSGKTCIYDPALNYQTVFQSDTYQEAKFWLLEDEYSLVEGRLTEKIVA